MRIQHNIMAMNAYRNYNNNTSALSKNLEKLSSGYKINRAGDDAAGLAISEKMRAQITGLKAASKNVKDGVSLVKTAEGALQEVHDMLNRMDSLATQSANGTYDNEVDRLNLQKEVKALKDEIDRIADSANFNGKKLLDGSLDQPKVEVSGATIAAGGGVATSNAATSGTSTTGTVGAGAAGAEHTLTVEYADASGKLHSVDVKYTSSDTDTTNATNMIDALKKNGELSSLFEIGGTDKIVFTNKQTGPSGIKVTNVKTSDTTASVLGAGMTHADGKPASVDVTVTGLAVAGTGNTLAANDNITINGTKYQFVANASDLKDLDKGVVGVLVGKNDGETIANLNKALESTGIKAEATAAGKLTFKPTENGSPLKLQIGDTADEFNQLSVSVGDMHAVSLGIGDLSIASQEGAAKAIDKIKTAINTVSSTRGDLGAIQNRLEHTQNNLSVMTENIQDAESTIRDTDVADEMMAYTKNNILIQSAQAMLAQANQVPQGVLQLLQ